MKIRFLCSSRPKQEWSGPLFFTVEGTIAESKTLKITLQDFLLMDVGTGGATNFSWDEDVVTHMIDHPELEDMIIGHIHSHNNMGVFFSATDMSELNDNCPNFNYYLSVIVNNNMQVAAKIAFVASPQVQAYASKDENGTDYSFTLTSSDSKRIMFMYDCTATYEVAIPTVPEEFMNRLKLVEEKGERLKKEEKEESEKKMKALPPSTNGHQPPEFTGPAKNWGGNDAYKRNNSMYPPTQKEMDFHKKKNDKKHGYGSEEYMEHQYGRNRKPSIPEQFATFIIRLGHEVTEDALEDAISDLHNANLNIDAITDIILDKYEEWYMSFFVANPDYLNDEKFLEITELVAGYIKVYNKMYEDTVTPLLETIGTIGVEKENEMKEKKSSKKQKTKV